MTLQFVLLAHLPELSTLIQKAFTVSLALEGRQLPAMRIYKLPYTSNHSRGKTFAFFTDFC